MNAAPTNSITPQLPKTNSELLGFGIYSSQPSKKEPPTTCPPLIQGLPSASSCDPRGSVTTLPMITPIAPATSSCGSHRTHDDNQSDSSYIIIPFIHDKTSSSSVNIPSLQHLKLLPVLLIDVLPYLHSFDPTSKNITCSIRRCTPLPLMLRHRFFPGSCSNPYVTL